MIRIISLATAFTIFALFPGCAGTGPREFSEVGATSVRETGQASYYAHRFHGRQTASGAVYDETALTAAHRTLPFGTRVRVTNLRNGKNVVLEITDRGPFVSGRIIDVSWRAAQDLDFVSEGVVDVRLDILERGR